MPRGKDVRSGRREANDATCQCGNGYKTISNFKLSILQCQRPFISGEDFSQFSADFDRLQGEGIFCLKRSWKRD